MDAVTDNRLLEKLDLLIRLVALDVAKGLPRNEQLWLLSTAGLQPKEISELLGTTPNTVRVTLSQLRKEGRKATKIKENQT